MMPDWFRVQPKTMPPLPQLPEPKVPAGGMPALPATPPPKATGWTKAAMPTQLPDSKQGISAAVVMQHFARGEIRSLNTGADALYARLFTRLKARNEFRKFKDKQIQEIIKNVTFMLQTADLTINFKAQSYFTVENTWKTYAQMYDLAQRDVTQADGTTKREMRLADGAMNPAMARDAADTRVTFGSNITNPGMQGVSRFMQTGGLTAVGTNASGSTEYAANNPHFNPKARQQFAALNYGRRPHGGIQGYGGSHFVLRDSLKDNAIYYVGDTFTVADANSRVTYGTLFAVAAYASDALLDDILNSCYRQMSLCDVDFTDLLIEGHIFEQVAFAKDIKEMRISEKDISASTANLLFTGSIDLAGLTALRTTIKDNARKFASRNGIKLVWMD
jgi:hypothetical protein